MDKILVFGSSAVDLIARTPHLPVPGETVMGSMFKMAAGGKGFNQGIAAHKSGGDVTMVTKMGNDTFGKVLMDFMHEINMKTDNIIITDKYKTGVAVIMVDERTSHNKIVIVPDSCKNITDEEVMSLSSIISNFKYLLTQLETNMSSIKKVCDLAYKNGVKIILNPAPVTYISDELYKKISIITPNEVEAKELTGIDVINLETAEKAASVFIDKGVETVIITLGEKGVYIKSGNDSYLLPAMRVNAVDTTGAGDAFNGGLVTALANGFSLEKSVKFANVVAGLSVTRMGAAPSMPTKDEVMDIFKNIE